MYNCARFLVAIVMLLLVGGSLGADDLRQAIGKNDVAQVKKLLAANSKLATQLDKSGNFPLLNAFILNYPKIVEALVAVADDLEMRDRFGRTALIYAAWYQRRAAVQLLLARGAKINAKDDDDLTALHRAAGQGDLAIVALLLAKGAEREGGCDGKDIRPRDTPLQWAVQRGYYEVAELLLEKGARVDGGHPLELNPALRMAAEHRDPELVRLLLHHGANPNGRYVFSQALRYYHQDVLKLLLAHKVELKNPDHLITVASKGDLELVEILLARGAVINGRDQRQQTALMVAAMRGHAAVVALLLVKRADVRAQDKDGMTALHFAQNDDVVEMLLAHGADAAAVAKDGSTPLHWAANKKAAERLVAKAAPVHVTDKHGRTPLTVAVFAGDRDRAEFLVAKGARHTLDTAAALGRADLLRKFLDEKPLPKEHKDYQQTALHLAVQFNQTEAAALLLDRDTPINAQGRFHFHMTPLHLAAKYGHKNMVALLLARKADLNAEHSQQSNLFSASPPRDWTPLGMALTNGHAEVAAYLIAKGAEPKLEKAEQLNNWLHYAASRGHLEVAKYFLAKGAAVNGTHGTDSLTPLHRAAEAGQVALVDWLLSKGANLNPRNDVGETPLVLAVRAKQTAVVEFLLKRQSNPDLGSPLAVAVQAGQRELVELLLKYNATLHPPGVRSPLLAAVQANHDDLVKLLLDRGADPRKSPEALHAAALQQRLNLAALLIAHGADVNVATLHGRQLYHPLMVRQPSRFRCFVELEAKKFQNHPAADETVQVEGKRGVLVSGTPLQAAVAGRSITVVKLLLSKGAKVEARLPRGDTALHLAAQLGEVETMELLLAAKADVNVRDDAGVTPQQRAVQAGRTEAAKWLRSRGAKE